MPVQLGSKLPHASEEARIEIVPLIDIMFFLLAAFMLVSLSMVHSKSLNVTLPTASQGTTDATRHIASISIDKSGAPHLNGASIGFHELASALAAFQKTNDQPRVFISGDRDCRHGDVIRIMDLVRAVGIERIGFEVREPAKP